MGEEDCESPSGAQNGAFALRSGIAVADGEGSPVSHESWSHGRPSGVSLARGLEREMETRRRRESDLCYPTDFGCHVVCSDWVCLVSSPGTCSVGLCRTLCG